MSSFLGHESSDQLFRLDCMWDWNDLQGLPTSTFPCVELYLGWDCVSSGDGKFSESQSISINKYEARKIYYATFLLCATE
jgi:hypothetical protein